MDDILDIQFTEDEGVDDILSISTQDKGLDDILYVCYLLKIRLWMTCLVYNRLNKWVWMELSI